MSSKHGLEPLRPQDVSSNGDDLRHTGRHITVNSAEEAEVRVLADPLCHAGNSSLVSCSCEVAIAKVTGFFLQFEVLLKDEADADVEEAREVSEDARDDQQWTLLAQRLHVAILDDEHDDEEADKTKHRQRGPEDPDQVVELQRAVLVLDLEGRGSMEPSLSGIDL